jgi:uncharacterized membrane protein YraQ (UPF0718 family)
MKIDVLFGVSRLIGWRMVLSYALLAVLAATVAGLIGDRIRAIGT